MLHRKENEEPNQNKVFALFLVSEDARGQQCRAGSDPQGRGHVCQPLLLFNLKGHFRAPTFEGCPRIGGGGQYAFAASGVPSRPSSLWPLKPTHQDCLSKALPGLGCPQGTTAAHQQWSKPQLQ